MSSIELLEAPDEIQNIASKAREELLPKKSKFCMKMRTRHTGSGVQRTRLLKPPKIACWHILIVN